MKEVSDILEHHLAAAWNRRKAYIKANRIEAFRLARQEELEMPVAVDVYGNAEGGDRTAVLQIYDEQVDRESVEKLKEILTVEFGVKDFFEKRRYRVKDAPEAGGDLREAQVEMVVTEYGHKFLLNLNNYLDTGLFLDHRETRRMVEKMVADMGARGEGAVASESASGRGRARTGGRTEAGVEARAGRRGEGGARGVQVLNLFAYTGSFSVYAAAGGAEMTHTVDLSKTYCDWARRNLELNGFPADKNWIYRMDAMEFYRYAARKGLTFDLIIIDPPTFSRNKESNFSVQRDQVELIEGAASLLRVGGRILFSNNCLNFQLATSLQTKFSVTDIQHETVPLDFWIDTGRGEWWEDQGQIHNCFLMTPRGISK